MRVLLIQLTGAAAVTSTGAGAPAGGWDRGNQPVGRRAVQKMSSIRLGEGTGISLTLQSQQAYMCVDDERCLTYMHIHDGRIQLSCHTIMFSMYFTYSQQYLLYIYLPTTFSTSH